MTTTLANITDRMFRLELDGSIHLAVKIGTAQRSGATKQFNESKKDSGWIYEDEHLTPWAMEGFTEFEGDIYLYGPYREGRSLREVIAQKPENAFPKLKSLASVLAEFEEQSLPYGKIQSDAILFLDDGGLLFLPPSAMERIRNSQTESERLRTYEIYNNPDLATADNASFSLGVMAYALLTGVLPFNAETEEEIHQQAREYEILSPRMLNPDVSKRVSAFVMSSLGKEKSDPPTTARWVEALSEWILNGYTTNISEDERAKVRAESEKAKIRSDAKYARKRYFRRNGRVLVAVSIASVFILSLGTSILRNALAPPVTLGMEPIEVVELFYASITTLDHAAIEDCVEKGVAPEIVREAINLFVISRQRMGSEGTTGFAPANEWVEAGHPDLRPGYSAYGIANLSITSEASNVYIAEYEKWQQISSENPARAELRIGSEGSKRVDRLVLEKHEKKDYWMITVYERLADEKIDVAKLIEERDSVSE